MNNPDFISLLLYIVVGGLGWVCRQMYSTLKELSMDVAKLREELPTKYVAKDDFRNDLAELKSMLRDIGEKLDGKADKKFGTD